MNRLANAMQAGTARTELDSVLDCSLGDDPADPQVVFTLMFRDCDTLLFRGGLCWTTPIDAEEEASLVDGLAEAGGDLLMMLAA